MLARAVFSTGPCTVQTKRGKDVHVLNSEIVATSTIPPEEWYTTPRGDVQAEWLRRLRRAVQGENVFRVSLLY